MRKIMAISCLKYKKVQVCSIPNRLEERQDEFDDYIVALDWQLNDIVKGSTCSHTLVFLDECIFM